MWCVSDYVIQISCRSRSRSGRAVLIPTTSDEEFLLTSSSPSILLQIYYLSCVPRRSPKKIGFPACDYILCAVPAMAVVGRFLDEHVMWGNNSRRWSLYAGKISHCGHETQSMYNLLNNELWQDGKVRIRIYQSASPVDLFKRSLLMTLLILSG